MGTGGSWRARVAPPMRRTPKSVRQGVLPQLDAVSSHSRRLALVAIFPALLLNRSGPKEWLVGLSPVRKLLIPRNQTCAMMRSCQEIPTTVAILMANRVHGVTPRILINGGSFVRQSFSAVPKVVSRRT